VSSSAAPAAELSVVCPVHFEGENIGRFLDELAARVAIPLELLVVYDREDDDTIPAVRARRQRLPYEVRLVQNQYGDGALGAIRTGMREARCSALLVTMCDLCDDLSAVERMFRLVQDEGYDVVCGSRYMPGGSQSGGPLLKRTLSRLAGLSLHALGLPTHDVTNSFKLYRRENLEQLEIESSGGFEIGMEIVVKTHARGGRITEVPSSWKERSAGKSRFRLWRWMPHYLRWWLYALRARRSTP
jgi:glycosyltransferase involved in cell wall biosynthesis